MDMTKKTHIVERATWETFPESAGSLLVKQPNFVKVVTKGVSAPHVNGVLRFEFEGDEAIEKIKDTIGDYLRAELPFRWKICSSTRPKNIGQLLEQNGMYKKDVLLGLIALPGQISQKNIPDIKIKEVTLDNLDDWLIAEEVSWANPRERMKGIREMMERALSNSKGGDPIRYVAYFNKKPVATAGLSINKDYGYLMGAAVDPEFRGKGIYRALLQHRIQQIEKNGLPTVNHCLENTSAPICLKLGFGKVCEISSYESSVFRS